jgi:hypothetical protein
LSKQIRLIFRSGGLINGDQRGVLVVTQHGGFYSRTSVFTFTAPLFKFVTNSAFTGSCMVSVVGVAFSMEGSIRVNLGRTLSTRTVWTSDSMIQTRSNQGSGRPLHAVLSAGGQIIEYSNVFSYDVPAISSFLANGPTSGGVVFVKLGSNFGGLQTSSRAKVGITAYFSTFISDSSIGSFTLAPCASLPSFNLQAQVEVGVDSATRVSGFVLFSYDPPHISSWSASDRPISGLAMVTLFGNHFGPQELTLNPIIGRSACSSPLFVSYTAIYCKIPALILRPSQSLDVIMGRGDQRATLSRAFTYEVPEVDASLPANVPNSGNVVVTFSGRRYGAELIDQKVRVEYSACVVSTWVSDTSIICK